MAATNVSGRCFWRDASAVILPSKWPMSGSITTNKSQLIPISSDYKILLVKRSAKGTYGSNHVYPGGTVSDADYDPRWIELFRSTTSLSMPDIVTSLQIPDRRPPIMKKTINGIPADIAMRICAIRETFEEAGILLAQPALYYENSTLQTILRRPKSTEAHLETDVEVIQKWRFAVQPDASKFVDMCIELSLVPNIWSLVEWSNWLTPVKFQVDGPEEKPKRFDTMFYMCCLDSPPDVVIDEQEIVGLDWLSPAEVIEKRATNAISTNLPQVYESLRLSNLPRYDDLLNFVVRRSRLGIGRTFGVIIKCSDGYVSVLEDDELYPKNADYEGTRKPIVLSKTMAEVQMTSLRRKNRFYSKVKQLGRSKIIHNIKSPRDGHFPLMEEEMARKFYKSSL